MRKSIFNLFAAGTAAALLSACTVNLPDEPRKFKIGREVPEGFEFFRSDEEIRGRLLSGTWKSRPIKEICYTENTSSRYDFKPYRTNSLPTKTTLAFVFFEDGIYTQSKATVQADGEKTTAVHGGKWTVKNGSLRILPIEGTSGVPEWEFYSLRFRDEKTIELLVDDLKEAMDRDAADWKEIAAKNNGRYLRQNWKMFRDENGNTYSVRKFERVWNGSPAVREKMIFTSKQSPVVLERQ